MIAIVIFIFVLSCYCIVHFFIVLEAIKKKNYYYSLYKAEFTKSHFAKARNTLMNMAIENKIDANSGYFKMLYHLNTIIMRNPDYYEQISQELRDVIWDMNTYKTSSGIHPLTPHEKEATKLTADALGHIAIEYSPLFKLLYKLRKKVDNSMTTGSFITYMAKVFHERQKLQAEKEIKKLRQGLYKIADIETPLSFRYDFC